jgi:hypothetical protein
VARVGERALSTPVGYTLNIAIATLLLTTLLVAGGGLVEDQRERVARAELNVIGERLAGDLLTADRLARSDASAVTVRSQLPARAGGIGYRVVVSSPGGNLTLTTSNPDVSVEVPVGSETTVAAGEVRGGDLRIEYDGSQLVVSESG